MNFPNSSASFRLRNPSIFDAPKSAPSRVEIREADIHNAISAECRRLGWIALHGSMATATARTIGEPDFVIIAPYGRLLLIEAKGSKTKVSTSQQALHAWALKLGHTVHIVRSFAEFQQLSEHIDDIPKK